MGYAYGMPRMLAPARPPTGHVFRVERKRGSQWYAKYRLPDGRQFQRRIGPAWSERGRPPAGYFTKRTAEAWLRDLLDEARRGTLPGLVQTGATFADAAAEFLRYVEHDRGRKPSTISGYRSVVQAHLLPGFGALPVESITTPMIEAWIATIERSPRTRNKLITMLHGILERARKVYGLTVNPAANVETFPQRRSGDIAVFSAEEVWALVRAAASEQDAAIYLTASFTGLRRGELVALRWRDVDFAGQTIRVRASYANGALTTPKSGKVRAVPMAPEVAELLTAIGRRDRWTDADDVVFIGVGGSWLDASALRRRYDLALRRAGLRRLRFHDLRHTFGTTMAAAGVPTRTLQEWMGHADAQTTQVYAHYAPRAADAQLVTHAFKTALRPGRVTHNSESSGTP